MTDAPVTAANAELSKGFVPDELTAYLTELQKKNGLRRVVAMDKLYVVNRGESPYYTRYMMGKGEYQQEPGLGAYCKGHATPGMLMRETQHHCIAYANIDAFLRESHDIGYRLTYPMQRQLEETGMLYVTNGIDNRLPWVVPVNRKMLALMRKQGKQLFGCDRINTQSFPLKENDWLECDERERKTFDGLLEGRKAYMEKRGGRSKAYGLERYRFLDTLT